MSGNSVPTWSPLRRHARRGVAERPCRRTITDCIGGSGGQRHRGCRRHWTGSIKTI